MANGIETAALAFLEHYGYVALFVLLTLETAMILHFVPSELIITLATASLATNMASLVLVILVSTAGATVGAVALYAFARWGGRSFIDKHAHRLHLNEARLDQLHAWFSKPAGESLVFFLRLVPFLRALVSIPAGLARMDIKKFVAYSAAGSLVFNAALAYTTYATQRNARAMNYLAESLAYWAPRWAYAIILLLATIAAAYVLYRRRRAFVDRPHHEVATWWRFAALLTLASGAVLLAAGLAWPALTYRVVTWIAVDAGAWAQQQGVAPLLFLVGLAAGLVTIGLVALALTRLVRHLVERGVALARARKAH